MKHTVLISGKRAGLTTLSFDPEKKQLDLVANYAGPFNVSWVEPSSSLGDISRLVGLSEGKESGLIYTFEIDHAKQACKTTSQRPTLGAPAHFITLRDGSAVAVGTYLGGSAALYPISITENTGLRLENYPRTEIFPDFPYKRVGHGPNQIRQQQCHVHQMLEDKRGFLYAPDLGSDRVWIFRRDQLRLDVCGWLQCPPGTGTRHAVFTPDEKIMYVLGELSHTVLAFDMPPSPAEDIRPIDGFAPSIIPPSVHPDHQSMMDSAELCLHPTIPNVVYASNRGERHIKEREPDSKNAPKDLPLGDAIAILLLSDDSREVQETRFVRTNLDTIRGMRLSHDGQYMAVCGQEGGGVEIYQISGQRGEIWTLTASLNEGLESGIKHAVWL